MINKKFPFISPPPPSQRVSNYSQSTPAGRDGVPVTGKARTGTGLGGRHSCEQVLKAGKAGVIIDTT